MVDISDLYTWWDEHFDQYKKDLSDYVAIPSIAIKEDGEYPFGKNCYDMLEFISALMEKYSIKSRIIKKVFAEGIYPADSKNGRCVAIACHGDVVPVSGEWESDPFKLFQKEDHLVGRGTTDNKGAGIAVLYSFRYLISKGWKPSTRFKLLYGSAEEVGMPDCEIAFKGEHIADLTLVPDSGFPVAYGEKASLKYSFSLPFGNRIRNIAGGTGVGVADFAYAEIFADSNEFEDEEIIVRKLADGWIAISAKGKGRHSATPDGGVDAFKVLFEYIDKIIDDNGVKEYLRFFVDFYGLGLGINVADKESGALTAVVTKAENSRFQLNLRLPLSANSEKAKKAIEEKLYDARLENQSLGYKMEINNLIDNINQIANSEYETEKPPYVMAGGTYARVMQPAIAFGMGSPSGNVTPPFPAGEGRAHQINESVHIERMKKGFIIYVKTLLFLEEYYGR